MILPAGFIAADFDTAVAGQGLIGVGDTHDITSEIKFQTRGATDVGCADDARPR